jgi:methyl-accepting chemotaxis protein
MPSRLFEFRGFPPGRLAVRALSIRAKLMLALWTLAALMGLAIAGGWTGTAFTRSAVTAIYDERVVPLRDLKVVADLYAVNIVDASHKARNGNITHEHALRTVRDAQAGIARSWAAYRARPKTGVEIALAAETQSLMGEADRVTANLIAILERGDAAALEGFTTGELYWAIDPVSETIGKLVELQLDMARHHHDRADRIDGILRLAYLALIGIAAVALGLAARTILADVSRPLGRIAHQMGRLASGDLAVAVTDADRSNEIGALARALQVFKDAMIAKQEADREAGREAEAKMRRAQRLDEITRAFEGQVEALTRGLATAASDMEGTARAMTAVADETNGRSVHVASAAAQTSANVQTVASATEELSISIRTIADQVTQSSGVAERALAEARRTNATVGTLAGAAERIGDVVALISTVAGQTNLLALNATIEAARAGEAGAAASRSWRARSRTWRARRRAPRRRSRPRSPRSSRRRATPSRRSGRSPPPSRRCRRSPPRWRRPSRSRAPPRTRSPATCRRPRAAPRRSRPASATSAAAPARPARRPPRCWRPHGS